MFDIAIIGAGAAGISAAIYATSRNMDTLVIEKESEMGGLVRRISTVTHFVGAHEGESGPEFARRMADGLNGSKFTHVCETVEKICKVDNVIEIHTQSKKYQAKKLIIAAGTTQNELECGGIKKYVSHCAVADGHKFAGQDVFVIGGSDGAAKEALFLSAIAKNVTMIAIEKQLSAIQSFKGRIFDTKNITVFTDSSVTKILGDDELSGVEVRNNTTKKTEVLPAQGGGVFVYIGSTPNTSWLEGIKLENGYIVTDENMQTSLPGVYAVGDIRAKAVRQISTAVADGTIAAIHACVNINV